MSTTTAIHRHVAMCPFPFASHLHQMFHLSRKIATSFPDVHISFFTTSSTAAAISATAAKEEGRIKIHLIDSGLADGAPPPASQLEVIESFVEVARDSLRKGVAEAEEEVGVKITSIVADGIMTFACREIAEEKGVKWGALWTSTAVSLAAHMHTDLLRDRVGGTGLALEAHRGETLDEYFPGFPPIQMTDLPPEIFAVDNSVARILHQMSLHLPKADAIIVNSFDSLEPYAAENLNSTFPNKFLLSGSFALTIMPTLESTQDPHNCLTWLDTHSASSVIYISFGSGAPPPLEEFSSLAEALESLEVPFLWSIPDRFKAYLPEGFVERTKGKLVAWAPQMAVLKHVAIGAQLTHCGWNSVLEGIVTGVPMICRSAGIADQRFNGRLVCDVWGIGVEIEGGRMTKTATMAALERVLLGEEGKKFKEKILVMKRLAEEAGAHPDGSSTLNMRKFVDIILS